VTGLAFSKNLAVALGEKAIAAMDLETGKETLEEQSSTAAHESIVGQSFGQFGFIDRRDCTGRSADWQDNF